MPDFLPNSPFHPEWLSDSWESEFVQPRPTMVQVEGGVPLLYPGEVQLVFGRAGKGKTWFACAAVLEVIRRGGRVLVIDYEGSRELTVYRMKLLGMTKEQSHLIAYVKAIESVSGDHAVSVASWVRENDIRLVVLDSVARGLAAAGCDENANGDVARFFADFEVLRSTSAAVLMIDHIGKGNTPEMPTPRGASAKVDQVSVAYYFDTVRPWDRETSGRALLRTLKCRFGDHLEESVAAQMNVQVEEGCIAITFTKHEARYPGVSDEGLADRILEVVGAAGRIQTLNGLREVIDRDDVDVDTLRQVTKSLSEHGLLVVEQVSGHGYRYSLPVPPPATA